MLPTVRIAALLIGLLPTLACAGPAKNVILMIADGASWGTWDLASHWEYGERGRQPYDGFPVKLGMTSFPLNTAEGPTGDNDTQVGYDPKRAWDARPAVDGPFQGYRYLKRAFTDSAAAATALATGIKTYNSAINYDNRGRPLRLITQIAASRGKATGVVTSVPFTHATPAAFEPIENRGVGKLPGVRWHTRNHANEITFFRAKGAGAERFLDLVVGRDPGLESPLGFNDGRYIDNAAVFQVMMTSVNSVPLPGYDRN